MQITDNKIKKDQSQVTENRLISIGKEINKTFDVRIPTYLIHVTANLNPHPNILPFKTGIIYMVCQSEGSSSMCHNPCVLHFRTLSESLGVLTSVHSYIGADIDICLMPNSFQQN